MVAGITVTLFLEINRNLLAVSNDSDIMKRY